LASFASGLEGYWGYYRRAEDVYQRLLQRYPRAVVEVCACGWQLKRQSTNSKDDGIRKRLAQEVEFYDDYAASLLPEQVAAIRKDVEETLDAEVRSASLVENIKITLRPLLATCRGQVDQERRCWNCSRMGITIGDVCEASTQAKRRSSS